MTPINALIVTLGLTVLLAISLIANNAIFIIFAQNGKINESLKIEKS